MNPRTLHPTSALVALAVVAACAGAPQTDRPPTAHAPTPTCDAELASDAASRPLLTRAMHLNREGQWRCALELAELVAARDVEDVERCEAHALAAVSAHRLGALERSRSALDVFGEHCASVAPEHWMHRELASLSTPGASVASSAGFVEVDDGFWSVAEPAAVGLDAEAVEAHRALCEETGADAVLVVSGRNIVSEWTSPRYADIAPLTAMSSTKSVTALLALMLMEDGRIESLDAPIGTWLPDWREGLHGEVTLRHLLTHTSGLARPADATQGVGFVEDKGCCGGCSMAPGRRGASIHRAT